MNDLDLSVLPTGIELLLLARFGDYNPAVGLSNCPDCDVQPGAVHDVGCDVSRCSVCKMQAIQGCDHVWARAFDAGDECATDPAFTDFLAEDYTGIERHDPTKVRWNGVWPGTLDCIRLGFFCYPDPSRSTGSYWVSCNADHPQAVPDMNRLSLYHQIGRDPYADCP
ncbi:MAG: hypothetical protein AB7L09_01470 [Nitrospira sp.]